MIYETKMPKKNEILVAALYKFVEINDLLLLKDNLYNICEENNIMGTILIADEGINGTISGKHNEIKETISSLTSDDRFSNIEIKYSSTDKQPFHRMKVRLKKEIVTIGIPEINPNKKAGTYVKPENWNELISDPNVVVIDARNKYETKIGSFHNAIDPETSSFREFPKWVKKFKSFYDIEFNKVINNDLFPTKDGLTMGEVIKEINNSSKGDAVIVTDVGQHQMVACRYAKFNHSKSNITSGGLGTMGFALPAAIGAKMGAPEREVVAVIGDGGYQMTIQELGTIFQTGCAVKIVVLNNDYLGMVRQWQQLFFDKRYASTEMVNPNFIKIAEGYSIEALKVTKRKNLKHAVSTMIESTKPFFLEVCVEKEANVFPMIPTGASVSDVRLE